MRAANVMVGIAVTVWSALAFLGHSALSSVAKQQALGYPSIRQIDAYVGCPLLIVAGLLAIAWACNVLQRWTLLMHIVAGAAIFVAPLVILFMGGGL